MPENSSEEEEEESDRGRAPPTERWNFPPPSPRAAKVVVEQAPAAGTEAPAAEQSVEQAPARAAGGDECCGSDDGH
jgi:hypothetical protein